MIFISIMIALVLTVFAASQLSQVLPAFGQLWRQFFQTLTSLLDFTLTFKDNGLLFSRLITSIPLALGLLLNSLQPIWQKKATQSKRFEGHLKTTRQFPKVAAYIVLGSLCFTYALFILTATSQMGELLSLNHANIPAHQASHIAVQGFWQLVRVSTLNLGILAGLYIFLKKISSPTKGFVS